MGKSKNHKWYDDDEEEHVEKLKDRRKQKKLKFDEKTKVNDPYVELDD
jgi:hypothetical protein